MWLPCSTAGQRGSVSRRVWRRERAQRCRRLPSAGSSRAMRLHACAGSDEQVGGASRAWPGICKKPF